MSKGSKARPRSAHITLEVKDLKYDLVFGSPEKKELARERLVELGEIEDEFTSAESEVEPAEVTPTDFIGSEGPFEVNDIVIVVSDKKAGHHVVIDPHKTTDVKRLDDSPVGHYVLVRPLVKHAPVGKELGHHESNLRKVL